MRDIATPILRPEGLRLNCHNSTGIRLLGPYGLHSNGVHFSVSFVRTQVALLPGEVERSDVLAIEYEGRDVFGIDAVPGGPFCNLIGIGRRNAF